ncbi:uncharacterized protein LOC112347352 [Selaginella moellendorffii]|uniref:uncharacterized protein LOC112347352 n=1 Tax=Selaginella moellendorffii TaxID=88036 RepID=UPI000D1C7F71|nr:uncharacterized protein LOC112347352 [Selaginella moellendorffii]|eukprot:XP_024533843.1 uncharacterized protein LOC112347352 [Selaginella moellendorffii]
MQQRTPLESDLHKAEVTIEFLRARLVSERSICKVLRGKTADLEGKICQLENRLEGEIARRKNAELATKELILALQYPAPPVAPSPTPRKHHISDQKQKLATTRSPRPANDDDSGCNCKLTTIFSFPRSSKPCDSGASSSSSRKAEASPPPPPPPLREISLRHGIGEQAARISQSGRIIRAREDRGESLPRQQSKSMELIHYRSEQQQMWVALSDSDAQLSPSPSPRRLGKSCRTIPRRDL